MTDKRQKIIAGMKYVILVFIILYLIMLMVYASGSKRAFSEVEKAVSSVLNSDELTKMDERMLKKNFGLNSADYQGVMYYASPSSVSAAEVLLIQVKNESQTDAVTDSIEKRKAQRMEDFEGYLPEEVKLLEDAQLSVRGKYIFYAVSSDASKYRNTFDKSL